MAVDRLAEKMSEASAVVSPPKKGERFRCDSCGMELQITKDCGCESADHVHLECCGRPMSHA